MADTTIGAVPKDVLDVFEGLWGPYWINTTTAVIVYIDSSRDVNYIRTTDGGASWGTLVEITTDSTRHISVWFDKETPSDTGNLIHIMWMTATGNDINYNTVDIGTSTGVGTERKIDDGVTVNTGETLNRCCITKARNGNLVAAFSTQTEVECYRSTNNGVSWEDRADVYETATEEDYCLLFPANVDDGDVCGIFWDRSADAISTKMYDESANSWTEIAIVSSMADNINWNNWDGSVRHSDGLVFMAAHSSMDDSTDDLITFTVDPSSITAPTINTTTGICENQAESTQACMLINQQTGDVYVAYLKGGTWAATVDAVYHKSDDSMATWGTEQAYSEAAADDIRDISSGRTVGDDGGFFQPAFYNQDLFLIYVNSVNDVAIAAAAVGGASARNIMTKINHFSGGI